MNLEEQRAMDVLSELRHTFGGRATFAQVLRRIYGGIAISGSKSSRIRRALNDLVEDSLIDYVEPPRGSPSFNRPIYIVRVIGCPSWDRTKVSGFKVQRLTISRRGNK